MEKRYIFGQKSQTSAFFRGFCELFFGSIFDSAPHSPVAPHRQLTKAGIILGPPEKVKAVGAPKRGPAPGPTTGHRRQRCRAGVRPRPRDHPQLIVGRAGILAIAPVERRGTPAKRSRYCPAGTHKTFAPISSAANPSIGKTSFVYSSTA